MALPKYDEIPIGYITIEETMSIIDADIKKTRRIIRDLNLFCLRIYHNKTPKDIYLKSEIEEVRKQINSFWNEHIIFSEVEKFYSKRISSMATKIKLQELYRRKGSSAIYVCSVSELEEINYKLTNGYFSYKEALDALNLNQVSLTNTIKELNIDKFYLNGSRDTCYLLKEDVFKIKEMQTDFIKDALDFETAYSTYGASATINNNSYSLPSYARCFDIFRQKYRYYKKSEIENYINKRNIKEISYSIESDTIFNTYESRLNVKEFKGFGKRPYTEIKWNNFVDFKLKRISGSDEYKNRFINIYIHLCISLLDFLEDNSFKSNKDREIYSLSTNEINLFLNTLTTQHKRLMYQFLKEVAQDIVLNRSEIKSRGFNFNKIKNPYIEPKKRSEDINDLAEDLYTFEEYISIFAFLTNIDFHLNRYSNIEDEAHKTNYLSIWLYLTLQLTNTWRTGDICSFPRLNFDAILIEEKINDIDWFYYNKLSKSVGRKVVTIIKKHDFFVSKTGERNNFRASDEVCQVLNTIIFMLELSHKNNIIANIKYNNLLMLFSNKYNNPQRNQIDNFFKGIDIVDFKFLNKKMTKTIMSFSKAIAPAEYDIFIPQYERSHLSLSSTLHYVRIPQEHMNFISEQLFERGEFGYIYDTLIDIVFGNKDKELFMKEKTDLITNIKTTYGDELKIEASVKLTNYYNQIDIINMLYEKGLDECSEILTNIQFNNLPSKEPHLQCLCSESGCLCPERGMYPEKDGCIGCKYSIPTIYSITVLGDRLKKDFNDYANTSNKIKQRKLSMRICKYKKVLKDAISKYGQDYIYGCIGIDMPRNEFMDKILSITSPSDIFKTQYELLNERM